VTTEHDRPFDLREALATVEGALSAPVPGSGPAARDSDPATGEWAGTRGEGFLLLPLWEGPWLTGVYGADWNAAEERAEAHLAALTEELDQRWGAHRTVSLRVPLFLTRSGPRPPLPEPYRTLAELDYFGDLTVWGPLRPSGTGPRWLALSLQQPDGDAPMVLTALITTRPLEELPDPAET